MNRKKVANIFILVGLILLLLATVAVTIQAVNKYMEQKATIKYDENMSGVDYWGAPAAEYVFVALLIFYYPLILVVLSAIYNIYRLIKGNNSKVSVILRSISTAVVICLACFIILRKNGVSFGIADNMELSVVLLGLIYTMVAVAVLGLDARICDRVMKGNNSKASRILRWVNIALITSIGIFLLWLCIFVPNLSKTKIYAIYIALGIACIVPPALGIAAASCDSQADGTESPDVKTGQDC